MKLNDRPAIQPTKLPYGLSEDQHTAIYRAQHLCNVLSAAYCESEFVNCQSESLSVVFGLISDLLDSGLNPSTNHDQRSSSHA